MFLENFLEDLAETHGEEFHTFRTTKIDSIIMPVEMIMTSTRERVSMYQDSILKMTSGELFVKYIIKILV